MLIRSQDRKSLVNYDNITEIGITSIFDGGKISIEAREGTMAYNLGYYETKERALKVLDMIEQAQSDSGKRKYGVSFQMPQEVEA